MIAQDKHDSAYYWFSKGIQIPKQCGPKMLWIDENDLRLPAADEARQANELLGNGGVTGNVVLVAPELS